MKEERPLRRMRQQNCSVFVRTRASIFLFSSYLQFFFAFIGAEKCRKSKSSAFQTPRTILIVPSSVSTLLLKSTISIIRDCESWNICLPRTNSNLIFTIMMRFTPFYLLEMFGFGAFSLPGTDYSRNRTFLHTFFIFV